MRLPRGRGRAASAAAFGALALCLTGCGTPVPDLPPVRSTTGGYGNATVALLVVPTEGERSARLLLIEPDGRFRTVPTLALTGAVPVSVNGSVHVPGPTDVRVTADRTVLTAHTWEETTPAHTAVANTAVGDRPWTLLQTGAHGVVVAGEGDTAPRADIDVAPRDLIGCGDAAFGLLPGPVAGPLRLATYRLDRTAVTEVITELPTANAVADPQVACLGERPVLLGRTTTGPVLAQEETSTGSWRWRPAPGAVGASWGSAIGSSGPSLVLQGATGVRTVDPTTGEVRRVASWPSGQGTASVSGNRVVLWVETDRPTLTVLDLTTGTATNLDTSRIAARLGDEGRVVRGAPILLGSSD